MIRDYNYTITLTNTDGESVEYTATVGATSPRGMQQLAAKLWGEGTRFTMHAPRIGLYLRDTARL